MWNKLKQLAWLRLGISIALAVGLAILVTFALHFFSGKPRTLTSIEARSEFVSFTVFNPDLAILYAQGLRIFSWPDGELDDECVDGAFLPGVGARVTYQRTGDGPLQATIEGQGKLRRLNGDILPFDGELMLVADAAECKSPLLANRLPVWGPGRIGSAFSMRSDGPSPALLNGTLDVFGRTVAFPLWGDGGAIYVAIEDMAIPAGSLIQTDGMPAGNGGSSLPNSEAAMFGFVELSEEPGLSVSVSTESPQLSITPPGARADSSRIDLSLFVQVINDPIFLKIQLVFALAFLLWPALMDAINLAHSRSAVAEVKDGPEKLSAGDPPLPASKPAQKPANRAVTQ